MDRVANLSPQQKKVFELFWVKNGNTTRIATILQISVRSVQRYVQKICQTLGINNKNQLQEFYTVYSFVRDLEKSP